MREFRDFTFICFPLADDSPCLAPLRPNDDNELVIEIANGHVALLCSPWSWRSSAKDRQRKVCPSGCAGREICGCKSSLGPLSAADQYLASLQTPSDYNAVISSNTQQEPTMQRSGEEAFENAIKSLEATATSVGIHLEIDSTARRIYAREIKVMSDNLRSEVAKGKLTWAQAAEQAQATRNVVMQLIRSRTTPVARAFAEGKKAEGRGLNALVAEKAAKLFGKNAVFVNLTQSKKNRVFAEIVASAGKSRPTVTRNALRFSYLGRSVILLSLALSTYNVLTATNKSTAIKRELATTTAGVGGSIAAGALAGLACGPGAPVCVTIGAFVGGALAAFGAGFVW